jgi:ABC-2 type transport system permease protein
MNTNLLATAALAHREVVGFLRQPSRLAAAIGTPLLFWVVLGAGLGNSFQSALPGSRGNYLQYFYPGALLMVVLFSSIFGAISLIEDRREGFLQGVLVAPVSRMAIVGGKVLGGTILSCFQVALMLLAAPLAMSGVTAAVLVGALAVLALVSTALNGLSLAFAWRINSVQGFHGVMNLVLFPLWLFSGALFPASGAHPIIQWMMKVNPIAYAHSALSQMLGVQSPQNLSVALVVVGAFAIVSYLFAWRVSWPKPTAQVP